MLPVLSSVDDQARERCLRPKPVSETTGAVGAVTSGGGESPGGGVSSGGGGGLPGFFFAAADASGASSRSVSGAVVSLQAMAITIKPARVGVEYFTSARIRRLLIEEMANS